MEKFMRLAAVNVADSIEDGSFANYLQLLPQNDQNRIMRYVNQNDRDRALVSALLARALIAEECNLAFHSICIAKNGYGKPYLPASPNTHFNISHSGEWVVCAIDRLPVGIDVEQIVPMDDGIADRFFALPEKQLLAACRGHARLERFFELWTLKESYVKAVGKGLSIPLDSFRIDLTSKSITVHTNGEQGQQQQQAWHFQQYPLHRQYKLSVCASQPDFPPDIDVKNVQDLFADINRIVNRVIEN